MISKSGARPSLSVQSRLLIASVLLTVTSIAVVSWLGYRSARASLTAAAERQLVGLERSKAEIVRTLLTSARRETLALCRTEFIVRAGRDLRDAYQQSAKMPVSPEMKVAVERFYSDTFEPALAKRLAVAPPKGALLPTTNVAWYLHYHYLVNSPQPYDGVSVIASKTDEGPYAKALAKYRDDIDGTLRRLSLPSIAFVDPDTLEIYYQHQQSTSFGTSLADGPYASSGYAALVQQLRHSKDVDDYRVGDFEAWWPAFGSPKAFIAVPVFDGSKLLAIAVLRFPIEPITTALSGGGQWEAEGLGKTGEVYLLGADMTMRTDSRFLIQDRAAFLETIRNSRLTSRTADVIDRLNTTIMTVPVRHAAAQAALNGQSGVMQLPDYRGVESLVAYGPVDLDSLRWGVIAKMDQAEAMAPLHDYLRRVLITGAALALLASLVALALASALTAPIAALVRGAHQVSQGALDVQVPIHNADEYRKLGEAFNDMVRSLQSSRTALDHQIRENERLLESLLPASGAAQIREGSPERRQSFADVTVAYVSLIGLEALSRDLGEEASMAMLSELVAAFDEAADHHSVEKVRTIGSSYLAASGLSMERPDHTASMVEFAREVVRIVRRFNTDRRVNLVAEIGINAGPVIGGLVGGRKIIYDLWGDTVKLAKGIESDGRTSIQVTRTVYDRVRDFVSFGPPTRTAVRGIGTVELYSVTDEAAVVV